MAASTHQVIATPQSLHSTAPSTHLSAERVAHVAQMESMGFAKSAIDAAMLAASGDCEVAIDYLLAVS